MYGLPRIGPTRYSSTGLPSFDANKRALSVLFNLFIWCQIVNQINARRLKDEYDVFDGLLESRVFMSVLGVEALLQFFIMMTPVSALFKVTYLNLGEWVLCLAIGASTYLVSMATRYVSRTYFAAAGAQKYAALD